MSPETPLQRECFEVANTHLQSDRSLASAGRIVRRMELLLDRAIDDNKARHPESKQACKPGCDHCCYRTVLCRLTDVVAALAYIEATFTEDQKVSLKERLFRYERAVAPLFGLGHRQVRAKCPLLVDGLCSIYPARPLQCRAIDSLDASACEQLKLHPSMDVPLYPSPTAHGGPPPHIPEGLRPKAERPEQDADVPRTPGQYDLLTQAHTGLAGALSRFGLASGLVDFGRALAIALDDPALLEGYFKGGHGMAPADLRKPISKTPRIAGMQPSYPVYKPGDEPTGTIVPSDLLEHFRKFTDGDTLGAVACLTGRHPVNLMRKIVVPMLYRSEDEVLEWRERVTAAINDLSESDFDSREAFDALLALGTFDIAYQQFNDRDLMSKLGDTLVNRITSKALPDLVRPIERKPGSGKFKVGYISENLSSSNGGSWALGWLKNRGEDIETYCFCLNGAPDWISMRFRDEAEHFYVFREDVPQHARFIKSLDLDVLIYTDIGMSGRNWQYASMRLAPVQCTAWGHPVTSGLPTIDCYLSSELMEPPNGQDHYREKLVLLPGSGLCYPRNVVPASRMYKGDFGLDEGPLYLSCQNPMKYLPRWDYLYREICESTARPIVFVEGPMPMEKGILKKRMKDAGINAIWLPGLSPSDFLALIRLADVCLDTPGWNGGNTTIHSLTEGKPVITLPGEFMRGRHTLAFAAMAGVPGIVAGNPEDYVSLACDPCRLSDAMRELNADALYEDPRPVCALDDFIRSAR